MTDTVDIADLPPKLAEIAERVDLDAALKLSAGWPGIRLFVPKEIMADHPIAVAIGVRKAKQLAYHYGGESIVPPACTRLHRARQKAKILAEYFADKGPAAPELARKYGVHQFTIYRWAAEAAADAQLDMLEGSQ